MKTWKCLALLSFLATGTSITRAQSAHDAPSHLDRIEWSLLAADATTRGLDAYSTYRASQGGGHDAELPSCIAEHPAAMSAYSGGVVVLQYFLARSLFKHGHTRLAHLITAADVVQVGVAAGHNLTMR